MKYLQKISAMVFAVLAVGLLMAAPVPVQAQDLTVVLNGYSKKLRDNRDGTYSEQVYTNSSIATYSAGVTGLVPIANATDVFTITGSATKTIKIRRIQISLQSSAAGSVPMTIVRRSTANSAGTAITAVKNDTSNADATATVQSYNALPTLGTTVGVLRSQRLLAGVSASIVDNNAVYEFGGNDAQPFVLRGTSDVIAINFNGSATTVTLAYIAIEWTEE